MFQSLIRPIEQPSQVRQIRGNAVGHSPLQVIPDKLVGIQFRRIGGKAIDMQPWVSAQKFLNDFAAMLPPSIPQKNDRTPDVFEKMPEERGHLRTADVFVVMEARVEGQSPSPGRDRDGRDRRDLGPVARDGEKGSLPSRGPGPPHRRDQQKARLIQKGQMGTKPFGLFLYGATDTSSNEQSRSHPSHEPSSPASDSSSLRPGEAARGDWDGRRFQTVSGSRPPPGELSRDPWNSRVRAAP